MNTLILKFGDIKGGDFEDSPEALKMFENIHLIKDRQEYHNRVIDIINAFNGQIIVWWGQIKVTKEKAIEYVNNYPVNEYWS